MFNEYPLGKTPLDVRVGRYISHFGKPADGMVPMHPTEFMQMLKSSVGFKELVQVAEDYDVYLFPIGDNGRSLAVGA
jgi:hypothetical protein